MKNDMIFMANRIRATNHTDVNKIIQSNSIKHVKIHILPWFMLKDLGNL